MSAAAPAENQPAENQPVNLFAAPVDPFDAIVATVEITVATAVLLILAGSPAATSELYAALPQFSRVQVALALKDLVADALVDMDPCGCAWRLA